MVYNENIQKDYPPHEEEVRAMLQSDNAFIEPNIILLIGSSMSQLMAPRD